MLRSLVMMAAASTLMSLSLPSMAVIPDEISPAKTRLSAVEKALVSWVDKRQDSILNELKEHVEINTGTDNIEGLTSYRNLLEQELLSLGFETQVHPSKPINVLTCDGQALMVAGHLSASRVGGKKQRVLINGHMDTVFSSDDPFQRLIIGDDGSLSGPGVVDMKGGIVIMLNALRALNTFGLLNKTNLTVLFNSDEEIGSLDSRELIEALAQHHDIGLVFEGTYQNKVTRARKGLGQARLKVVGRESHAGGSHENGVSANLELAHKVIAIESLTDYDKQLTVNTGVMRGGEKRNTIPGCADAYVDMRYPDQQGGQHLKETITAIAQKQYVRHKHHIDLPSTDSWAVLHRPVKPQHPKVDALIAQAMGISQLVGEPILGSRYSGGGTDGSIAQGVGLPTMDSLGMDGVGAHSSREASTVASLIARTKLAVIMLARELHKPR